MIESPKAIKSRYADIGYPYNSSLSILIPYLEKIFWLFFFICSFPSSIDFLRRYWLAFDSGEPGTISTKISLGIIEFVFLSFSYSSCLIITSVLSARALSESGYK